MAAASSSTSHCPHCVASLTEGLAAEMLRGQFVQYGRVVQQALAVAHATEPAIEVMWEPSKIGPWPGIPYTVFAPVDGLRWKLDATANRANLTHFGLEACLTWLQAQGDGDVSPGDRQAALAAYLDRYLAPNLRTKGVTMRLDGLSSVVFDSAGPATVV